MEPKSRIRRKGLLSVASGDAFQPFSYSVGRFASRFFAELREKKRLLGVRCPGCSKVYVPPRPLCGPCWREMSEWVEVGPQGTLAAFTILRFGFVDPETGRKKPVPYGYGFITLDGAGTQLQHFLRVEEGRAPRIGMRVAPVFAENRTGSLGDIVHFEEVS